MANVGDDSECPLESMFAGPPARTIRPQRPLTALRKSTSSPTLRALGGPVATDDCLEVYVVLRNFQEFAGGFFHRLPEPLRDGVRDCGVCHYMTVFRDSDGTLTQFDFGPAAGGDIHVGRGPLSRLLNKAHGRRNSRRRVGGSVREHRLSALPASHMYVGRTNLSLRDIRAWNEVHAGSEYELHRSDCRHYVNSLVHYSTGVERATISALRHQLTRNRERYGLAECVLRFGHYMTDVANWECIKAAGQATTAALAAMTGQQALARLRTAPLLRSMQQHLLPATRTSLVRRALVQRPVYAVGTAAVATYAASNGQAPAAVRETIGIGARLASGVHSAVRVAASLAEHVGRSASAAAQTTTCQTVALASGIAGVASRGAANLMTARPGLQRRVADHTGPAVSVNSSGPLRAILPSIKGGRAQHLAIVAARR
jgi:hypothetical protein